MILRTQGGDFNSFFASCMVLVLSLLVLGIFFLVSEPRWMEHWESFLTREAREQSAIGVMGWKMFHRTMIYPFFLLLPVMWMFAAFCLQRILPLRAARVFNLLHGFHGPS